MENLLIEGTKFTPEVSFDAGNHRLEMRGYSYPENAVGFYAPILEWIREYLQGLGGETVTIDLEMVYFNSSSSKILMDLFDLLDDRAEKGLDLQVNWIYDRDNESAQECGEEFEEGIEHLRFTLVEKVGGV